MPSYVLSRRRVPAVGRLRADFNRNGARPDEANGGQRRGTACS